MFSDVISRVRFSAARVVAVTSGVDLYPFVGEEINAKFTLSSAPDPVAPRHSSTERRQSEPSVCDSLRRVGRPAAQRLRWHIAA